MQAQRKEAQIEALTVNTATHYTTVHHSTLITAHSLQHTATHTATQAQHKETQIVALKANVAAAASNACELSALLKTAQAKVRCSMLQYVAANLLQCVAVCCSVLQRVAAAAATSKACELSALLKAAQEKVCCSMFGSMLQCAAVIFCSVLQCVAVCCSVLQCVAAAAAASKACEVSTLLRAVPKCLVLPAGPGQRLIHCRDIDW